MSGFIKIVLGDFTPVEAIGYAWFFIIGYLIYGLTEVSGRDNSSKNTPKEWSWKFWFHDNWKRYLTTILCSYIFFRFYNELSGHSFSNIDAVMLGMIGDGMGATIKNRAFNLKESRIKIMSELD